MNPWKDKVGKILAAEVLHPFTKYFWHLIFIWNIFLVHKFSRKLFALHDRNITMETVKLFTSYKLHLLATTMFKKKKEIQRIQQQASWKISLPRQGKEFLSLSLSPLYLATVIQSPQWQLRTYLATGSMGLANAKSLESSNETDNSHSTNVHAQSRSNTFVYMYTCTHICCCCC